MLEDSCLPCVSTGAKWKKIESLFFFEKATLGRNEFFCPTTNFELFLKKVPNTVKMPSFSPKSNFWAKVVFSSFVPEWNYAL